VCCPAMLCCGILLASIAVTSVYVLAPMSVSRGMQVSLQGAALCCGNFPGLGGNDRLALPPLNAVVLDFPQSHLDPAHDVAGMLGQEV
jgi:hypothetical protein